MKFNVEVDDHEFLLEIHTNGSQTAYQLTGVSGSSGGASIVEVGPGIFSVLLDSRSFRVHVAPTGFGLEVWVGAAKHIVSVSDARDRLEKSKKAAAAGALEIRAQMPGKIIKMLVARGETVQAGQGLVIVEAMKMQNEMKSPKDGMVTRTFGNEGGTVAAGDTLLVVE